MAKDFNKEVLMNNIYYLLKVKNIKVGQLEKDAEVSTGYLAKLNKEAGLRPGIELIMRIADRLGVSIDTLLGLEMYKLTGTEVYLIKFLEKLKTDTEAEKLMWGRETAVELAVVKDDENGFPAHPFFTTEEFYEDRGGDYPDCVEKNVFVSKAFGPQTSICGDCYNLRMKNGAILFLADVVKSCYKQNETDIYAKEIWIQTFADGSQFLCNNRNPHFTMYVENLFTAVAEYCKHPLLPQNSREVIDAFMKDDLKDDPVSKPNWAANFDEEPPF